MSKRKVVKPMEERRRTERKPVDGPVRLSVDEPARVDLDALLVEIGEFGFRATHHCLTLEPGQEARFAHHWGSGRARVVWNRILPDRVETGFWILDRQ